MSAAAIHETLVALLRHRAATQPDAKAYTFLEDGEREAGTLTFAELDRRARAIAVQLLRVAAPGERALLLHPPGIDYVPAFFGCLYARVVAVPAYPLSPTRAEAMLPRLERELGIPVYDSGAVALWAGLRAAGASLAPFARWGRLFGAA